MKKAIKVLFIDIDGTMTDGGIYYDEHGNELKKFNTKDAAGFFVAKRAGIQTVVVTGRSCQATKRRMEELKVDLLAEEIKDKVSFIKTYLEEHHFDSNEAGFIGDDLNDYEAMHIVGFSACPQDACKEVREFVTYVSSKSGGAGVVRDVIEYLTGDDWMDYAKEVYHMGI